VIVLERANRIGSVTSARNSEVIHAGIYYPKGSLKARSCVRGRELLYDFCLSHGVPFNRCGKLIVATSDEQVATLESIRAKGAANGVDDLRFIDRSEAQRLEPNVECLAALFSPSTGIIDSHAYMVALQGDLEDAGGCVALNSPVLSGSIRGDGTVGLLVAGDTAVELSCKFLINSAGLAGPSVAGSISGMPPDRVPGAYYAKGNYYSLPGKSPFSRLVYPVPEQAGLGVHATIDLGGQARFGPDVEWISSDSPEPFLTDGPHYDVDPKRADSFYAEVRKYWPALPSNSL
ncbi:unnamed protein product, partial [Polarella glacialis]